MLSEAYQSVAIRCSLVETAVALLRSLLYSALQRSSLNEPLGPTLSGYVLAINNEI